MPAEDVMPYDFTQLDDLYLSSDEYDDIAGFMCDMIRDLEEKAWADVDGQTMEDVDEYLRKYIVAEWRTFELEYAENAATRRGRVLPFHQAIVLDVFLQSDELDDNFLTLAAQYSQDELLQKVSRASAPWLRKYNVCLNYDSEIVHTESAWKIFIDASADHAM